MGAGSGDCQSRSPRIEHVSELQRIPVGQGIARASVMVSSVDLDTTGLSHAEVVELVQAARRLTRQSEAITSALVARAAELEADPRLRVTTSVSTAISQTEGRSLGEVGREVHTARQVNRLPRVREAALGGQVTREHAAAIADGMAKLPKDLDDRQRDAAQSEFLRHARTTPVRKLRAMDQEVLAKVAPDRVRTAEQEASRMQWQRKRAIEKRHFRHWDDLDGSICFSGSLPYLEAEPLVRWIGAQVEADRRAQRATADRLRREKAPGSVRRAHAEQRPPATQPGQREADALATLMASLDRPNSSSPDITGCLEELQGPKSRDPHRHAGHGSQQTGGTQVTDGPQPYHTSHIPRGKRVTTNGGERPRMVVTMSYKDLVDGLHHKGLTANGLPVPAGELRRIACDAEILPAVLGSNSQPLDVGRAHRLVTPEIRQALVLRDKGCIFPHCSTSHQHCEAHHVVPWHEGGITAINNLVLLCPYHHALLEPERGNNWSRPPKWQITFIDDIPFVHPPDTPPPREVPDESPPLWAPPLVQFTDTVRQSAGTERPCTESVKGGIDAVDSPRSYLMVTS